MQKTAYEMRISDWSSDVCSSDLQVDKYLLCRCIERVLLKKFDEHLLLLKRIFEFVVPAGDLEFCAKSLHAALCGSAVIPLELPDDVRTLDVIVKIALQLGHQLLDHGRNKSRMVNRGLIEVAENMMSDYMLSGWAV